MTTDSRLIILDETDAPSAFAALADAAVTGPARMVAIATPADPPPVRTIADDLRLTRDIIDDHPSTIALAHAAVTDADHRAIAEQQAAGHPVCRRCGVQLETRNPAVMDPVTADQGLWFDHPGAGSAFGHTVSALVPTRIIVTAGFYDQTDPLWEPLHAAIAAAGAPVGQVLAADYDPDRIHAYARLVLLTMDAAAELCLRDVYLPRSVPSVVLGHGGEGARRLAAEQIGVQAMCTLPAGTDVLARWIARPPTDDDVPTDVPAAVPTRDNA